MYNLTYDMFNFYIHEYIDHLQGIHKIYVIQMLIRKNYNRRVKKSLKS